MAMLPNETTYNKIKLNKVEDDLEICYAKDRWDDLRVENNEGETDDHKVYDTKTNTLNFNYMKATDMKVNKRVKMNMPVESEIETKRSNLKVEIMKVTKEFINEKCDKQGNLKKSNFNHEDIKATESLNRKVDNLEAVITTTDKSSKFSMLEPEIFIDSMKQHTTKDRKIDKNQLKKVVNIMNENSKSVNKIIGTGKFKNQDKRAISNVIVSKHPEVPVLSGTDKDHKKCEKGEVKMRPIVNAMVGPKKALSESYSKVLNYISESEKSNTVCKNTEELLEAFEQFNKDNIENKNNGEKEVMIIGSMDAVSLYPSLKVDRAEEIIRQSIIESRINIEGLDVTEIGIYLRKNLNDKEIEEKGFKDLLPQNIKTKNKNKQENQNQNENLEESDFEEEMQNLFKENKENVFKKGDSNKINPENINKIEENVSKKGDKNKINPEKMDEKQKVKALPKSRDSINKNEALSKSRDYSNKQENNKNIETKKSEKDNKEGKSEEQNKNKNIWISSKREPNKEEVKIMFAEVMARITRILMNYHVYEFAGELYIQEGNGSIGDEATGSMSDLIMIWWDIMFKNKLTLLEINNKLLKRYIDDINGLFAAMKPGTEFKDNKLTINKCKAEKDAKRNIELVTMEVIGSIANSIDPMLKFTVDVPSNHEDGKLPMLDTKVWIDKGEINFEFYQKEMKNKLVLSKRSAMPNKQKIQIHTENVFRRLHNTRKCLDDKIKIRILNEFMESLKVSGYNHADRLKILKGGINTYEKIEEKVKANIRPFYRPANFEKDERKERKDKAKNTWFKKNNKFTSVMFVEPTPNGELVKKLREVEEKNQISETKRIKFVEKSGIKLVHKLTRKNPFRKNCDDDFCMACKSKPNGKFSNCRKDNIGYTIICNLCKQRGMPTSYEGESARNMRSRGEEHLKALKRKDGNSILNKHIQNEHTDEKDKVNFEMHLTGIFKTPLERQINEGNRIKNKPNNILLNSKQEYHKPSVDKSQDKSNLEFKCKNCSFKANNTKDMNKHMNNEHTRQTEAGTPKRGEAGRSEQQQVLTNSKN